MVLTSDTIYTDTILKGGVIWKIIRCAKGAASPRPNALAKIARAKAGIAASRAFVRAGITK
jgi:hypothetical protein